MKDSLLIHASSSGTYKSRYKKGDKAKIRNQQYINLNTGAKEIQQVNPGGPDTSQASGPYHLINEVNFVHTSHIIWNFPLCILAEDPFTIGV